MSTKTLHSFLSRSIDGKIKNFLIIDSRPFKEYLNGHIPGSVNIDLMQFHWLDTTLIGIKQFNRQSRRLLSNVGIKENDMVIFYDETSGPTAARGVWLLLYFSHEKVALLDGGFNKWKERGYKIEKITNEFRHSKFLGEVNREVLATAMDIFSVLEPKTQTTNIIDTRSKAEFDGTIVRGGRRGHLPNAINIDWNMNLSNGLFKKYKELAKLYSKIPKNKQVITYCQGGYRAANTFLVLKLLGYKKVKVYLGSWGEWSSQHNLPVEI